MGTVQSIQFLQSGKCLAISTDVTRRNAANKALGVLDFESVENISFIFFELGNNNLIGSCFKQQYLPGGVHLPKAFSSPSSEPLFGTI